MIIDTGGLTPQTSLTRFANYQVYNGLDCCVTLEVLEELQNLHNKPPEIYSFEQALQGPFLEIMNRGFLVNQLQRRKAAAALRARSEALETTLSTLAQAVWGKPLNPRSPKQLQEFFFKAMNLPEVWLSFKGQKRLSTNREALEKLDVYMHAQPFISIILTLRDIGKQLDVMETTLGTDGRFRTSYNIAGTETGRISSSSSSFGDGGNAQNISSDLRYVFVADPGWKICVIDLEQVEARDVGFICGCLFGDWDFLDACESGDLHTANAQRIWPELPWTDDLGKNKAIAEREFYRGFSYRDMAKRGSHLTNYSGTAWTAARSLKVPLGIMEEFQARYCLGRYGHPKLPDIAPAFPALPRFWQWVHQELQTTQRLTNLFGRERIFFGRPNDATTQREAIANVPQSSTADRTNLILWRIWKYLREVQLLAQTHDSVTFQVREGPGFDDTVAKALALFDVPLFAPNGRRYSVPGEAKVGWNWGYAKPDKKSGMIINPEGLIKWKPGQDKRVRKTGLDLLA